MLKEKAKNLPQSPGVYIFKNSKGEVIYIGKAKNLKARVGSYFQKSLVKGSKTESLVEKVADLDVIEVISEIEALVLEAHLIQKHKPHYNIALKDDKSFLYIEIRNEKVTKNGREVILPTLRASRKSDLKKDSKHYGPFPSSTATRFVLRSLRRYFPYRDCSDSKFSRYAKMKRPCLYGKIDLCPAPCVSNVSSKEYRKNIHAIENFLEGKATEIISELEERMLAESEEKNYEEAANYRNMLSKFNYIRKKRVPAHLYSQNPNLKKDLAQKSLQELNKVLPIISEEPSRIECYDISDLSGENSVGSMVVAIDGKMDRSKYRKFKIKSVEGADDFAKMAEVLERRLKRLKEGSKGWERPDLIVLDGGRGQLSAVKKVLKNLNLDVPVIGLAKREETVVYFEGRSYKEVNVDPNGKYQSGFNLLIRLRDEAHRFAQAYHHKLRLKDLLK